MLFNRAALADSDPFNKRIADEYASPFRQRPGKSGVPEQPHSPIPATTPLWDTCRGAASKPNIRADAAGLASVHRCPGLPRRLAPFADAIELSISGLGEGPDAVEF